MLLAERSLALVIDMAPFLPSHARNARAANGRLPLSDVSPGLEADAGRKNPNATFLENQHGFAGFRELDRPRPPGQGALQEATYMADRERSMASCQLLRWVARSLADMAGSKRAPRETVFATSSWLR